ncbi:MAG: hypothetical protein J6K72_08365 [Clostridia bacterium]|nr:hypothetical protein [Clostridia bacterium]
MMPDNKPVTIYEPTVWKDHIVEKPRTYTMVENEDGTVTQFPSEGEVMQQGTPMNASNMNKLEKGLEKVTEEMQAYAENGTAANALCLDRKPPEYYLTLENFFDNSNWTDPVYQEGLGGLHGAITYALDRWIYNNTADTLSFNGGAGLSFGIGSVVYQKPIRCDVTDGSDYTVIIWTSDGAAHCTKLTEAYTPLGDSGYSVTNNGEKFVYIANSAGRLPIKHVGLFRGVYTADQLRYVPKVYAVELAECQRIYNRVKGTMGYGVIAGTSCVVEVPLPTTMRGKVNPTVVINSGTAWAYYHAGYLALTYIGALHSSNGVKLRFSCSETASCSCVVPDLDISVSEDL